MVKQLKRRLVIVGAKADAVIVGYAAPVVAYSWREGGWYWEVGENGNTKVADGRTSVED